MSTASMTTGQFREFAGAVLRSLPDDLDPTTAERWIENQEGLRKVLREALVPDSKPASLLAEASTQADNIYPLSVDYERSVEDLVKAGQYDRSDPDITSRNFPTKRKGRVEIVVVLTHFKQRISTDEVCRDLDKRGYRTAELRELLTFGVKYQGVQREFPIVALDSCGPYLLGDRRASCLSGFDSKRSLSLLGLKRYWDKVFRFAAVRLPAP